VASAALRIAAASAGRKYFSRVTLLPRPSILAPSAGLKDSHSFLAPLEHSSQCSEVRIVDRLGSDTSGDLLIAPRLDLLWGDPAQVVVGEPLLEPEDHGLPSSCGRSGRGIPSVLAIGAIGEQMPRINLARKGIRDDRCPDAIKSFGGLSRRGWIGAEAQQRAPDCDQEKPASHRFTPTVMPAQFYAAEYNRHAKRRTGEARRTSFFVPCEQ
jgi:hypothetical protein